MSWPPGNGAVNSVCSPPRAAVWAQGRGRQAETETRPSPSSSPLPDPGSLPSISPHSMPSCGQAPSSPWWDGDGQLVKELMDSEAPEEQFCYQSAGLLRGTPWWRREHRPTGGVCPTGDVCVSLSPRCSRGNGLQPGHAASAWRGRALNPGLLDARPEFFPVPKSQLY